MFCEDICGDDYALEEFDEYDRELSRWDALAREDKLNALGYSIQRFKMTRVRYEAPPIRPFAVDGAINSCLQQWQWNLSMFPGFDPGHVLPYLSEQSGCVLATRWTNAKGYMLWRLGFLPDRCFRYKRIAFHRISYALSTGNYVLPGQYLAHRCGQPNCVNPLHLDLASCRHPGADLSRKRDAQLTIRIEAVAKRHSLVHSNIRGAVTIGTAFLVTH